MPILSYLQQVCRFKSWAVQATIDGEPVKSSEHMLYNGVMLSDVPNMAMIIGYVNASWTLKVDIAADYICRLLNYMDKNNYDEVIPSGDKSVMEEDTVMGSLSSGYISRAADVIPKQGKQAPWQVTNNYLEDRKSLKMQNLMMVFYVFISIQKLPHVNQN